MLPLYSLMVHFFTHNSLLLILFYFIFVSSNHDFTISYDSRTSKLFVSADDENISEPFGYYNHNNHADAAECI